MRKRTISTTFYAPPSLGTPPFPRVVIGHVLGVVEVHDTIAWASKYDRLLHEGGWTLFVTAAFVSKRRGWRMTSERMARTP